MSEPSTELVTVKTAMLLPRLASAAGLEPAKFYSAVKTTCGCEGATDEHFAVLLMVADKYQLNPMLKQLYLMKTQKGVQVIIPVDGWVPLLVHHPDYLAHDVVLHWEGVAFNSKCLAASCRIWTRTRQAIGQGPFEHAETMQECYRDTGPWKSHPTRMLGHKAVIQATRRCFGIYVMDEDEARNIGETLPSRGYSLPTDTSPTNIGFTLPTEAAPETQSQPDIDPAETRAYWLGRIAATTNHDELSRREDSFNGIIAELPDDLAKEILMAFDARFKAMT